VDPPEPTDPVAGGARLKGKEAAKLHFTLVAAVALCLAAFWFEVRRALGGNELSWAYVFEWPIFAVFAGYMWWTTLHQNRRRKRTAAQPKTVAPEHVQMLQNWQEHLRTMAAAESESSSAPKPQQPSAGSTP
jgi:hypothetical protein